MNKEDSLEHFGVRGMKWGVRKNHKDAAKIIGSPLESTSDSRRQKAVVRDGIRRDLDTGFGKDRVNVDVLTPRLTAKNGEVMSAAVISMYGKSNVYKGSTVVAYTKKTAIESSTEHRADRQAANKAKALQVGKTAVKVGKTAVKGVVYTLGTATAILVVGNAPGIYEVATNPANPLRNWDEGRTFTK